MLIFLDFKFDLMSQTTQPPKGFRDFLPLEQYKRDFVTAKVKAAFEQFGFNPLVTPTVEYAATILGKYGEEADRLVYKFTNRGDKELALRYDQTVPTSRVLAEYSNELPKYFRRYQIQNVFRGEKPQKGRYREFTQCDIDIFGSTEVTTDAEILACAYQAFKNVGFKDVVIKINDRQVLFSALESIATEKVSVFSIIQTIDKLDKKTEEEVKAELVEKGLSIEAANTALANIRAAQATSQLSSTIDAATKLGVPAAALKFTPELARGLDYYTSIIWEFLIPEYGVGSVAGGGRYDNLIKQIGGLDMPATGMAFGFDRIVEAADELGLIPTSSLGPQVLVGIFSDELIDKSLEVANLLRQGGIRTELFVGAAGKLDKQFKYANNLKVKFVAIVGPDEAAAGEVQIKDMLSGEQSKVALADLVSFLQGK